MKTKILACFVAIAVILTISGGVAFAASAGECNKEDNFFGIPTWYKYLQFDQNCNVEIKSISTKTIHDPVTNKDVTTIDENYRFTDIFLIMLAILEMVLVLAGLLAFIFVVVGGFKYVVARGNPDKIVDARRTILNALIGAVIAVLASQTVSFIARKFADSTMSPSGLPIVPANSDTLVMVFNVVLTLLGSVTVLVIVISGLDFMFSQGEPDKIARARNTIIYALIGMVVIIFAAVIVNFVIGAIG